MGIDNATDPTIAWIGDPVRAWGECEAFFQRGPLHYNVIATVLDEAASSGAAIDVWTARTSSGLTGVAVRTPGHDLNIGPMDRTAVRHLVQFLAETRSELAGVYGPAQSAACFAGDWNLLARRGTEVTAAERLMAYRSRARLGNLAELVPQPAEETDRNTVIELLGAFYTEVGGDPAAAAAVVDKRLPQRRYFIVRSGAEAAGLIAISQPVAGAVRIQTVYIRSESRCRGLATLGVHQLAQRLRQAGSKVVLLTELTNPASNRAFVKAGFVAIGENLRFSLAPTQPD